MRAFPRRRAASGGLPPCRNATALPCISRWTNTHPTKSPITQDRPWRNTPASCSHRSTDQPLDKADCPAGKRQKVRVPNIIISKYFFEVDEMIYGYIRVSSDKQTVENQRFEIGRFCKRENIHIDGWIEETISGTKNYDKRKLGELLNRVQKDDLIICAELSRLGRNLFMIMEILHICMNKECKVWTIKDNYRLGDDIQSKVLAFAFGLSAEIERNLISQRTKEALARKAQEGVVLGRPKGRKTAPERHKLYEKDELICELLVCGISQRRIAKIFSVDRNTLSRFMSNSKLLQKNRKLYAKK